jgi:NADPH-dependent 7-cyano-7-deazaguanine reductase QueF|tara:strand:+ start:4988 stop:5233 length:246 start_codon:yes stop_codon:yes gene_type:complete
MAGHNKNYYRYKALHELGIEREGEEMDIREIMEYINSYRNKRGRLHKQVNTITSVIVNLLQATPEYEKVKQGVYVYTRSVE